jgi:hypothetical protein
LFVFIDRRNREARLRARLVKFMLCSPQVLVLAIEFPVQRAYSFCRLRQLVIDGCELASLSVVSLTISILDNAITDSLSQPQDYSLDHFQTQGKHRQCGGAVEVLMSVIKAFEIASSAIKGSPLGSFAC